MGCSRTGPGCFRSVDTSSKAEGLHYNNRWPEDLRYKDGRPEGLHYDNRTPEELRDNDRRPK